MKVCFCSSRCFVFNLLLLLPAVFDVMYPLIKGIVHRKKIKSSFTHFSFLLQWNTKGGVSKNVPAALFHTMDVNCDQA